MLGVRESGRVLTAAEATAEVAALIEATTRTLADVTVRLMSAGATPSSEAARRCLKLAGAKSDTLP